MNGMEAGSGLYLQVIPRPVMGTNPVSQRMLWHWSLSRESQIITRRENPVRVDPEQ